MIIQHTTGYITTSVHLTLHCIQFNVSAFVYVKILLEFESFAAASVVTDPLFLLCVCVGMPFQGTFLNEFFTTYCALKGLLSCVCSDMPCE